MGNALRSHEDLVHVRGWSKEQISTIFDTLRRKKTAYTMTKDEFTRYFGGRNREAVTVFKDLDTDLDGKVDIFEVLVVLTVWSGTPWDDKLGLLFEIFDMMDKGFLKIDEVMLMGTVLVQTVRKFVKIDPKLNKPATIKELAQNAIPTNESKLTPELFRLWVKNCEPLEQLRGHVEDFATRGQADSNESRMRIQISSIEKHANRLF